MALPYIWSQYKQLEHKVHCIVFTEQHKPKPTQVRELASEIGSFLQTCNKRKRKKVQYLIQQSLVIREKFGKVHNYRQKCAEERGDTETSSRLRRSICKHAYYFSLMNSLLPEQSRVLSKSTLVSQQVKKHTVDTPILTVHERFACPDPKEDVGVPPEIHPQKIPQNSSMAQNGIITSEVDFSLDEDDLDNFCTTLESGVDEMLATLTMMNNGQITPDIAIILMNCVYKEMSSTLAVAELLAPHWFNNKFLDREDHSFYDINILKQLQRTPADIRKDQFSENVMTSTIAVDRSIAPCYMIDFVDLYVEILGGQVPDSKLFHFSVLRHLLCLTESIDCRRLIGQRVATSQFLHYVHKTISHPYTRRMLGGDLTRCGRELESQANKTQNYNEPSLLCSLSYWGTHQLNEAFRMLLETPLITMTAHIYVYVRLAYKQDLSPAIDSFCNKHASVLFWDGFPQDIDSWCISYKNWVIPIRGIALRIARRRSSTYQNNSILNTLRANDFRLNSSTQNRFKDRNKGLIENLRMGLESEVPMNTFCLYEKVSKIAPGILCAFQVDHEIAPGVLDDSAQADLEVVCRFFQNRDRVAKPFILELDKALDKESLFPYVSYFRTNSYS